MTSASSSVDSSTSSLLFVSGLGEALFFSFLRPLSLELPSRGVEVVALEGGVSLLDGGVSLLDLDFGEGGGERDRDDAFLSLDAGFDEADRSTTRAACPRNAACSANAADASSAAA